MWLFIMENTQLYKDNITKIIFYFSCLLIWAKGRNKKQNKCKNKNCAVQDVKTVNMSYVIIIIIIIIILCSVLQWIRQPVTPKHKAFNINISGRIDHKIEVIRPFRVMIDHKMFRACVGDRAQPGSYNLQLL